MLCSKNALGLGKRLFDDFNAAYSQIAIMYVHNFDLKLNFLAYIQYRKLMYKTSTDVPILFIKIEKRHKKSLLT